MAKIRVETEVPDGEYCDCNKVDPICPMCFEGEWGEYYCTLFGDELKLDEDNHHYCIRCDKCKQAEVKDEKIHQ